MLTDVELSGLDCTYMPNPLNLGSIVKIDKKWQTENQKMLSHQNSTAVMENVMWKICDVKCNGKYKSH